MSSHDSPSGPSMPLASGCGFLSPAEVEAILDRRLSAQRSEEFENHSDTCPDCLLLAADIEVFREVTDGGVLQSEEIEAARRSEMLAARLRREVRGRSSVARRSTLRRRWSAPVAAAAVLILAVAGWIVLKQPTPPAILLADGSTLHIEAKAFSAPPVLRDRQDLAPLWAAAETAYVSGDFVEAERLLGKIGRKDPNEADAVLYRGVCLLMQDRPSDARPVLERALELAGDQGLSTASAHWYTALALLAEGDSESARRALAAAVKDGGTYGDKSRELLSRLD